MVDHQENSNDLICDGMHPKTKGQTMLQTE